MTLIADMAFKPSIAVFDACVLYPFHLRNILVQVAVDRLVEARWTDEIHDEWIRNLVVNMPTVPVERLQTTRQLMLQVLPKAMVTGYQKYVQAIILPDPGDRHVVAAGIAANASIIITWNLRDFPDGELNKFGLQCQTPDTFLSDLYDKVPDLTLGSLSNARENLSCSRTAASDFIHILNNQKLGQLAKRIQRHLPDL
jgi:predicted nucleic acid-binding protein